MFAIARRPVTNAEYARFRKEHGAAEGALTGVTWADAVGYCRWLTTSTSHIYRLPDEREWEKAARSDIFEQTLPREWTNSWVDGARVLRGADDIAKRRFDTDPGGAGFRVVRSMTGR